MLQLTILDAGEVIIGDGGFTYGLEKPFSIKVAISSIALLCFSGMMLMKQHAN